MAYLNAFKNNIAYCVSIFVQVKNSKYYISIYTPKCNYQ